MRRGITKRVTAVLAGLVALAAVSAVSPAPAAAADPVVLSGYNAARTDYDWGLTETYLSQTRGYLTDPAVFGPAGIVDTTYSIDAAGIATASAATLAGVDVFFTGWVLTTSYSAAEKTALRDFVVGGGTLIATTDDLGHTMVDAFGLTQGNGFGNPTANTVTNTAHPIAAGPFGAVSSYQQWAQTGHYSALGPDAVEVGRNTLGSTIAVIERGVLGPQSGAVIFVADVDVFSNAYQGATNNATLIKNIFAYAATPSNTPPDVTADTSTVTVSEGSSASNTGTFSDTDGDTVILSSSVGTVTETGTNTWAWSHTPTDGPTDSQTVTITADDGTAESTVTFDLQVDNIAPTITSLTASAGTVLTGQPVTFVGQATDPSGPDTTAGFSWSFNNGAYGSSSSFTTQYDTCGTNSVTALAKDKDDGISSQFSSPDVVAVDSEILPPLRAGVFNKVQGGKVVPVKISAGCDGVLATGLQPSIQLLAGDLDPSTDPGDASLDVPTDSVSSADTSGIMRAADGQYIYNLTIPSSAPGTKYTIRVRPTGVAAGGALYTVVQIR